MICTQLRSGYLCSGIRVWESQIARVSVIIISNSSSIFLPVLLSFQSTFRCSSGCLFFTISTLNCKLSPHVCSSGPGHNYVQITYNTSSTYHVQHVVYHVEWRNSSVIQFDRADITLFTVLFHWLIPLTTGGEEARDPAENPSFRKCHLLKSNWDSNSCSSIGSGCLLGKQMC